MLTDLTQAGLIVRTAQGEQRYALTPDRANSFEELYVDFQVAALAGGTRYSVFLHPKLDCSVQQLELQFKISQGKAARFFANGFQSESLSRMLASGGTVPRLHPLARPFLQHTGDEQLGILPQEKGSVHSWTYTVIESEAGETLLAGSLNERTGFTILVFDWSTGLLRIRKDLGRLLLTHSFPGLECWIGQGRGADSINNYEKLLTEAFSVAETPAKEKHPILGWSYPDQGQAPVSVEKILKSAEDVANSGLGFDLLLVDRGWSTAIGDWRKLQPPIQQRMREITAGIIARGLSPGLWLAPFTAAGDSLIVREHPDWLLRDARKHPVLVRWHALPKHRLYALNFYHPGVQDYLSGVFHIVLDQWGYQWLNPDFLYGACLYPPLGKTRGQVMNDAMEFLRKQAAGRKILAGAVPLGAAFGWADFVQVCTGRSTVWEEKISAMAQHRERPGKLAALQNALGRWPLNGRLFSSAVGHFSLQATNSRHAAQRQNTALTLKVLLGGVLFTSDDLGAYTPEQRAELEDALAWRGSVINRVLELMVNTYRIDFEQDGAQYVAYSNLTNQPRKCPLPTDGWLELMPFETMILRKQGRVG